MCRSLYRQITGLLHRLCPGKGRQNLIACEAKRSLSHQRTLASIDALSIPTLRIISKLVAYSGQAAPGPDFFAWTDLLGARLGALDRPIY